MKISRKFATSLDILVANGTNLVANATVLVTIIWSNVIAMLARILQYCRLTAVLVIDCFNRTCTL